jgi:hypothetical protein
MIRKGRKVPTWLEKWDDFEKQPDFQKAYQNLKLLSKILLFRMEKNFTSKEYFEDLSQHLLANHHSAEEFSKRYQELTYGKIKDDASKAYYKNYIHLLSLILNSWKKKLLEKIISRLKI